MRAYSQELRSRVGAAVAQGEMTSGAVAAVFGVGKTVSKTRLCLQHAGAELAPRPSGGGVPKLTDIARALVREGGAQPPDVRLAQWQARVAVQGRGGVSGPTLCRTLPQLPRPQKQQSQFKI